MNEWRIAYALYGFFLLLFIQNRTNQIRSSSLILIVIAIFVTFKLNNHATFLLFQLVEEMVLLAGK